MVYINSPRWYLIEVQELDKILFELQNTNDRIGNMEKLAKKKLLIEWKN